MNVEIRQKKSKIKTTWGDVERKAGISEVWVDGKLAGHTWNSDGTADEKKKIGRFCPLAGFPEELCKDVIQASNGELKEVKATVWAVPEPTTMEEE